MIAEQKYGIHISGIRDGHEHNLFSTNKSPNEFQEIFKDMRTAVNLIKGQKYIYVVHQTPKYSIASVIALGFRDRGNRPGAYITMSLYVERGKLFVSSPREKLIELVSFYKSKQGNNTDTNQFTLKGLQDVIGDLQVASNNGQNAGVQKYAGFALFDRENQIDGYLQLNKRAASAYNHYYFISKNAAANLNSFEQEICNLFNIRGKVNDLFISKPTPPTPDPGAAARERAKAEEAEARAKEAEAKEQVTRAQAEEAAAKATDENRQGHAESRAMPRGSNTGNKKTSNTATVVDDVELGKVEKAKINWQKVIFASIGLLLVGGLASYFMFFKKENIVTSDASSNATESSVKIVDDGGEDNDDSGNDEGDDENEVEAESAKSDFDLRVDSLRDGTMLCYAPTCKKVNGDTNPIIGRKIKYANDKWEWDMNENGKAETTVREFSCLDNDYKDLKEAIDKREADEAGGTTDSPVETALVETSPVETPPVETAPVETAPVEPAASSVYERCIILNNILVQGLAEADKIDFTNEVKGKKEEEEIRTMFMAVALEFQEKVESLPASQQSEFKSTVRDVKVFFEL